MGFRLLQKAPGETIATGRRSLGVARRSAKPGYEQPGYEQPGYEQPGYEHPGACARIRSSGYSAFDRPGAYLSPTTA
jgi:hypothetical protein